MSGIDFRDFNPIEQSIPIQFNVKKLLVNFYFSLFLILNEWDKTFSVRILEKQ